MRIASATLQRYCLPFRRPLATAQGPIRVREGLLVRLVTKGGATEADFVALGDAAPLPGYSRETLAQVEQALCGALAPDGPVRGRQLESSEDISQLLSLLGWVDQLPSAAHALDQALLELLAQRQQRSIWQLLAAPDQRRDRVPLHSLVETAEQAARATHVDGFRWLKVKVGAASLVDDAQRLARIREASGEQVALRLDANGCWKSSDEALQALDELSRFGVHSVEQPVAPGDIAKLARVREHCPVRVAADESVRSLADLQLVVANRAADAVVIKPMLCGGLTAAVRLAQVAADASLPVSITTTLESGIGRHAALQVAAAVPGELWSCGICTGEWLVRDLREGPFGERGAIVPPGNATGAEVSRARG